MSLFYIGVKKCYEIAHKDCEVIKQVQNQLRNIVIYIGINGNSFITTTFINFMITTYWRL